VVVACLLLACREAPPEAGGEPVSGALRAVPVDYHVHLLGPDLMRDWRALGVEFSRPDEVYGSPAGLLDAGEELATGRVLLVPMAHLYGSSELREGLGLSLELERERTARENTFVARQAAAFPGRAAALCSVSALRPYAQEELERCRQLEGVVGIKLHLASSEVDLRERADVEAVGGLLGWAAAARLPVLLHLDTQRRGTDIDDIERFLELAISPHPELDVVIAHLGGSGGYGAWSRRAFQALVGWCDRHAADTGTRPQVFFDLSAVLLDQPSEGVPATSLAEAASLANDLRAMDFQNVVFGSDYPVFDPQRGLTALRQLGGLTPQEIDRILAARVPGWFD
jgi:predicted TIM-barrel fold metal-dependent hydrolase